MALYLLALLLRLRLMHMLLGERSLVAAAGTWLVDARRRVRVAQAVARLLEASKRSMLREVAQAHSRVAALPTLEVSLTSSGQLVFDPPPNRQAAQLLGHRMGVDSAVLVDRAVDGCSSLPREALRAEPQFACDTVCGRERWGVVVSGMRLP